MNWHGEVVDASTRKAADRLVEAAPGFYLAGGTGLALRFGHRISVDLDLFSADRTLDAAERRALLEALRASGPLEILEDKDGTCHLRLEGTHVRLFRYAYGLLGRTGPWRGLRVASSLDIAAMKLSAAVGRGSRKDFVDLFFISKREGLDKMLEAARRKFADHPDFILQAGRALVFFEDAEKEPMPRMLVPASWDEIRRHFETEVPRILRRTLN